MKDIILVLITVLAALPLFAQSGAWGLGFDLQISKAKEILIEQGFEVIENTQELEFKLKKRPDLQIKIFPNPKAQALIAAWVSFMPMFDENGEDLFFDYLNALYEMHFEPDYEDFEKLDFEWYFANDRFIDFYYDFLTDDMILYYGDDKYPEFDDY